MKTDEELREYYEEFKKEHNGEIPSIEVYDVKMTITNAEGTEGFYPWRWEENGSWLDYWRAFADSNNSEFSPAKIPEECSNRILRDLKYQKEWIHKPNDIICKDIEGGHVWINHDEKTFYIIPLCRRCNGKRGEDLPGMVLGTKMVKMVDHFDKNKEKSTSTKDEKAK